MLKLLTLVVVCYLIVMAIAYFSQQALIYKPSQRGLSETAALSAGVALWPTAQAYRGYLAEPVGSVNKTFVLFHGNAGEAADRLHYLAPFYRENARVLLAEYPGYGARAGSPSEELFVADSEQTLLQVAQAFPREPIYVFGESLGSGIASATVGKVLRASGEKHVAIAGLGLITPFDSLVNVAQQKFPYLPVRYLLRDRYDSLDNLSDVTIPKAIILSAQDTVVPMEHGQNLAARLPEAKKELTIEKAGHSDWMNFIDTNWWDDYFDFLLQRQG